MQPLLLKHFRIIIHVLSIEISEIWWSTNAPQYIEVSLFSEIFSTGRYGIGRLYCGHKTTSNSGTVVRVEGTMQQGELNGLVLRNLHTCDFKLLQEYALQDCVKVCIRGSG